MKYQKSCGVIPFQIINNEIFYLLIEQNNGVISFPKGHVEKGKTDLETALRECFEETNIKPEILEGFKEEIFYYMPEYDAYKTVIFFVGKFENNNIENQESEIANIQILKYEDALEKISFEDTKKLLAKAHNFIKSTLGH